MTRAPLHRTLGTAVVAASLLAGGGCAGELARQSRSSSFLILDSLSAASGARPNEFSNVLNSDVVTLVEQTVGGTTERVPTFYNDIGRASLRLGLKDPGTVGSPTSPSTINEITVTRYRVEFRRADGRNTPGVDVPYGFDGALTATIAGATPTTVTFQIVNHSMKLEPPLRNLVNGGGQGFIHTIATVTFYGRDQAGNEVSVSGTIGVNFGDFADPN